MSGLLSSLIEFTLYLGLAGVFTAILESFTISGAAGLERLADKYPGSADLFRQWAPRWTRLQALHMLLATLFQVGALYKGTRLLLGLHASSPATFATGLLLLFLAFLLVVLILPIAVSESYADRITSALLGPTTLLTRAFFFATAPVAALEQSLLEKLRGKSTPRHRPTEREEILSLIDQKGGSAGIDEDEREIIKSVFDFTETVVREVMTPRVDVVGFEDSLPVQDAIRALSATPHTRYPVYHDNMDVITGVVHIRALITACNDGRGGVPVHAVMEEPLFIPETGSISDLMETFRKGRHHMAIVVDEFGGTAGIVTMEDVVEELVGDIKNDASKSQKDLERQRDGSALVNPKLPVDEVNEALGIHLPEHDEYDSAGGFVLHTLGRIPAPRERIEGPDFEVVVHSANDRQILRLRISPRAAPTA